MKSSILACSIRVLRDRAILHALICGALTLRVGAVDAPAKKTAFFVDWVRVFPGAFGNDVDPRKIAVDTNGFISIAGGFGASRAPGTLDVGITNLVTRGSRDAFLLRLDPRGQPLWIRQFGGPERDFGNKVAVDAQGNSYVAGEYSDQCQFEGQVLASRGSYDVYLARFSPAGVMDWVKTIGSANLDSVGGLNVDRSGNLVIVVGGEGAVFTSDQPTPIGSGMVTMKYDPHGNLLWATSAQGEPGWPLNPYDSALDPSGGVYVVGNRQRSADFGIAVLPDVGNNSDLFCVKYTADGQAVWAHQMGHGDDGSFPKIHVASEASFFVAASWSTTRSTLWKIADRIFSSKSFGERNYFIAGFDSIGDAAWARGFGGVQASDLWCAELLGDSSSGSYVFGRFAGAVSFEGGILGSAGETSSHILLAKYDSLGGLQWANVLDSNTTAPSTVEPVAAFMVGPDSFIIVGSFLGRLQLGSKVVVTDGQAKSIFVARVDLSARIHHTVRDGRIHLDWSQALEGYVPESSLGIDTASTWMPLAEVPTVVAEGRYGVSVPIKSSAQMFRLHHP